MPKRLSVTKHTLLHKIANLIEAIKESKTIEEKYFFQTQLVSLGIRNAASDFLPSFFRHAYLREGLTDSVLLKNISKELCTRTIISPKGKVSINLFFDPHALEVVKTVFAKALQKKMVELHDKPDKGLKSDDKKTFTPFLMMDESQLDSAFHLLGHAGCLLNKSSQIRLFTQSKYMAQPLSNQLIPNFFRTRTSRDAFFTPPQIQLASPLIPIPAKVEISHKSIIILLKEKLDAIKTDEVKAIFPQHFYLNLLHDLLSYIPKKTDSDSELIKSTYQQSLRRIYYLLSFSDKLSDKQFIFSINIIIDEIVLLMSNTISSAATSHLLSRIEEGKQEALPSSGAGGNDPCVKELEPKDCEEIIKDYLTKLSGETPDRAGLTSSGMQAIMLALTYALKEASQIYPTKVCYPKSAYFEIPSCLGQFLNKEIETEKNIIYSKPASIPMLSKAIDGENKLFDIYISDFESNVDIKEPGFHYHDPVKIIEQQLALRIKHRQPDRKLIVIIDETMISQGEFYLPELLIIFSKEIKSGKLAVIGCKSLNKYMHMGLDNLFSGLFYVYFNKNHFPHLDAMCATSATGGHELGSGHLTYLLTLLKYLPEHSETYLSLLRSRTKSLHKLFSRKLFDESQLLSIDNPSTNRLIDIDDGDSKRKLDLSNYWNFVVIRPNKEFYSLLTLKQKNNFRLKLYSIIQKKLKIAVRDGYFFSETTITAITTKNTFIFRISIGTEKETHIKNKVSCLSKYLEVVNEYFLRIKDEPDANEQLLLILEKNSGLLEESMPKLKADEAEKPKF